MATNVTIQIGTDGSATVISTTEPGMVTVTTA